MEFSLGPASRRQLLGVHPRLVAVVERAILLTTQDFSVQDGVRTEAEQAALVAAGATGTMNSKHRKQADGFGHAVDLLPSINGKLRWEWPLIFNIAAAMHVAATGLQVPLRWGGVWDRAFLSLGGTPAAFQQAVEAYAVRRRAAGQDAFLDGPHYELV